MKTINVSSVFGNFKWDANVEVSDSQIDALLGMGILQIMQRTPASAAEKEMAGYEKRPESFKRGSIPYSEANAAILATHLEGAEVDKGNPLSLVIQVSEYVPGVGTEPKYAAEKAKVESKGGDPEALSKLAKAVGYTGGDLTTSNVDFLKAIKVEIARIAATL